jgi:hypothetical protein
MSLRDWQSASMPNLSPLPLSETPVRAPTSAKANRYHLPLQPGETESQTVGCRHSHPDVCSKHSLETVCAFARADEMCLAPAASWAKRFRKLSTEAKGES